MKVYEITIGGIVHTMQFVDGEAPEGAVEVKSAAAPKNKAKAAKSKGAGDGTAAAAANG